MKTIVFIINSTHRISLLNKQLISECTKNNEFNTRVLNTNYAKHAFDIASQVSKENIDLIVAVGGDGTIHEIINGILSQDKFKPQLAILPNGTGNDFMRTRNHFKSASQFIQSILQNKVEKIDIGRIHSPSSINYFINIADIGFGGAVIHTLAKQRKIFSGNLAYSLAIFKTFFSYQKTKLTLTAPNYSLETDAFMVVFCNGAIFGSGLTIHPDAKVNDGQMEVVIIGNVSLLDYLRYLPKLKKGKYINHPEVKYLQLNELHIKAKTPQWTEADGEIICNENISVQLIPNCIEVIIP